MSNNAVMPLEDYKSTCNKIREKIGVIPVNINKQFSYAYGINEYDEELGVGTLIAGQKYNVVYAAVSSTSGEYVAENIVVKGVSTVGITIELTHPVDGVSTYNVYIYQFEDKIMAYCNYSYVADSSGLNISINSIDSIVSGELPGKIEKVYEAGKAQGTDEYWDLFTNYGARTFYGDGFRNSAFEYIRPTYKVVPTELGSAVRTFSNCKKLKKVEAEYFDFSKIKKATGSTTGFYNTFTACSALEEVEDVGLEGQRYFTSTFNWCGSLKKIARIGVSEDIVFNGTFDNCARLEDITFDGTISQNGLNLQDSKKLSKKTWQNIINSLSSTTTELSITGSLESVKKAFETSVGANDGDTSPEWEALESSKTNWIINLV